MKVIKTSKKLPTTEQLRANIYWGASILRSVDKPRLAAEVISRLKSGLPVEKVHNFLVELLRKYLPGSVRRRMFSFTGSTVINLLDIGESSVIDSVMGVSGKKWTSVGVLITDGEQFLAVHPTHSDKWDIPKGVRERGESTIEAAIREVKEECGIDLRKYRNKMILAGKFPYLKHKDLVVYVLVLKRNELPPTSTMRCSSYFESKSLVKPEVNRWRYIKFSHVNKFKFPKRLSAIIKYCHEKWVLSLGEGRVK